jgi:transcriptional regulator with XRE-family HTH domain
MRKLIYNIKSLRETSGLTIEELASALGTSPAAYKDVETEKEEITLAIFRKILRYYKLSPSELVEFGLTTEQINLKYMAPVELMHHPMGREAVLVQLEIADILRHIIELKISAQSRFIPFNPN